MNRQRPALPSPAEIAALPPDGGEHYNRLIHEQSPYLLQHAANPVDWWPWGDAAFAAARQQDKPVFLSIGYSTCHWCHVMEHQCFEDEEVAALMNHVFICIKVDREERPDVDSVYMTVTQAVTGSGGWPMTVLLTADRQPFFAGTYFPKHGQRGRPGMMELVPAIGNAWKTDRAKVLSSATSITETLKQYTAGSPGGDLDAATLDRAYEQLEARFDSEHGGFGQRPKFPTPHNLCFLLRYWQRSGREPALLMAAATAEAMRLGGVYDQIGFGTHRYSTDREWLVPHFEKMLYDQAQVALANLELFQITREPGFAETAREIFTYVQRDMTAPEGGFYSAEDADSEGEEGVFYLWTPHELTQVLGDDDAALFAAVYDISAEGNYRDEASGKDTGQSIPRRTRRWPELATELGLPEVELRRRLESARARLFAHREARIHPYKDDKVLTDWNGLMIAALARGGAALGEPEWTAMARRAGDFLWSTLRTADGRLLKRWRQGQAGLPAHLEDYAYLAWGYLCLYETTGETPWLQRSIELIEHLLAHFWDDAAGGFFQSADYAERLITRNKSIYDGAEPSGNSVAALVLLRLHRLTGRAGYEEKALALMRAFSGEVERAPSAFTFLMQAVDFALGPSQEIVIAGDPEADDTKAMLAALDAQFLPRAVRLLRREGDAALAALAPFTVSQRPVDGRATAYICANFACRQPTTDIAVMLELLGVETSA